MLSSAFNQHEFLKGGTQKQTEDLMLATLKESIRVPGKMICLLHPWRDPIPFRRVWVSEQLYSHHVVVNSIRTDFYTAFSVSF